MRGAVHDMAAALYVVGFIARHECTIPQQTVLTFTSSVNF